MARIDNNLNITEINNVNIIEDVIKQPSYLRKCMKIMNQALKDNLDVLQLENGDLLTTGTKYILKYYRWNGFNARMGLYKQEEKTNNNYLNVPQSDSTSCNYMMNPLYVKECSRLINQAIEDNHDIMQLENGNIIITITQLTDVRYSWDSVKADFIEIFS